MSALRQIHTALLLLFSSVPAGAQPSQEPASGIARLRDFEATYQSGLQTIQKPLLNSYVQRLQQLATASTPTDQPAIQAELSRVKKIIAAGGIIDLRSAGATQSEPASPRVSPGLKPGLKGPPGSVLVLKPDAAKGPAVLGSTLTLGKAEWTVEHLDAGTYEITVLGSFPPFTGTASITASLDGEEMTKELSTANAAGMPGQFPMLRLGRFQFAKDVENKDLKIELKAAGLPGVQVRQVVISRPRPPGK